MNHKTDINMTDLLSKYDLERFCYKSLQLKQAKIEREQEGGMISYYDDDANWEHNLISHHERKQ